MGTIKKTAILYDYDNLYITIENKYLYNQNEFNSEILKKIREKFKEEKILISRAFCDFNKVKNVLNLLQKNQIQLRHVYSTDSDVDDKRKNASDLALAIDAMEMVYQRPDIEKYVIVSGDSDMMTLVTELTSLDKEVFVIYSSVGMKNEYKNYLDNWNIQSETIETLLNIKNNGGVQGLSKIDILNVINKIIIDRKNKYNGNGTTGWQDLKQDLSINLKIGQDEANELIDQLVAETYLLKKSTIRNIKGENKNITYFLLNSNKLNEENIKLDMEIVIKDDIV